MKPGTHLRLPDGRKATVTYHGLDGYGVVWGHRHLTPDEQRGLLAGEAEVAFRRDLAPVAMLRDPYHGADLECVGSVYKVVKVHHPMDALEHAYHASAGGPQGAALGHLREAVRDVLAADGRLDEVER